MRQQQIQQSALLEEFKFILVFYYKDINYFYFLDRIIDEQIQQFFNQFEYFRDFCTFFLMLLINLN